MHAIDVGWTMWPKHGFPERFEYFRECWSALDTLTGGAGIEVQHVVSAEERQVNPKTKKELAVFCEEHGIKLVWHKGKPSLPANFENLLNACAAPYFFYMQEDWLADVPIDLEHGVKLLQEHHDVNILRYRWVGKRVNWGEPLDDLFCRIKTDSEWYYAHNPYLANRAAIDRLRPIGPRESKVNIKAKKLELGVALRKPSMFKHIGGASVLWGRGKQRPVER